MRKELITGVDPKSPVSEIFRTLRTNLQYLDQGNGAQTILITSTVQGEGKSFIAANLAIAIAQAEKKVLLIDSDMRRPRQHQMFGIDMYPGLSNYLSGVNFDRNNREIDVSECIYKCDIDNLSIMPSGNIPPNPSELLQSEKLETLIDKLKEEYDVVVWDGAPCLIVTDATIVSRVVDATLLVAAQKSTKVEDLKEAKNRINRVGGNVVGVVLNRVKITSKRYAEKYYYYASNTSIAKIGKHEHNKREDYTYQKEENLTLRDVENKKDRNINKRNEHRKDEKNSSQKIQNILDDINNFKKDKKDDRRTHPHSSKY